MSSRIRKLESEVDRGRQRDLFDISPNILREQIYEMVVNEGIPLEAVAERFRGRFPMSILTDFLNEAMVNRANGKEKV